MADIKLRTVYTNLITGTYLSIFWGFFAINDMKWSQINWNVSMLKKALLLLLVQPSIHGCTFQCVLAYSPAKWLDTKVNCASLLWMEGFVSTDFETRASELFLFLLPSCHFLHKPRKWPKCVMKNEHLHISIFVVVPWWPLQAKVTLFLNAREALFFLVFAIPLRSSIP